MRTSGPLLSNVWLREGTLPPPPPPPPPPPGLRPFLPRERLGFGPGLIFRLCSPPDPGTCHGLIGSLRSRKAFRGKATKRVPALKLTGGAASPHYACGSIGCRDP